MVTGALWLLLSQHKRCILATLPSENHSKHIQIIQQIYWLMTLMTFPHGSRSFKKPYPRRNFLLISIHCLEGNLFYHYMSYRFVLATRPDKSTPFSNPGQDNNMKKLQKSVWSKIIFQVLQRRDMKGGRAGKLPVSPGLTPSSLISPSPRYSASLIRLSLIIISFYLSFSIHYFPGLRLVHY